MKYEKILNETWEYLENNYKGSEITLELWARLIEKKSDSKNCLKKCLKIMWDTWEWFDYQDYQYYKNLLESRYNIIL